MIKGIGDRIKEIRKRKKLTQSDLGSFLKVSQQTIARYENDFGEPSLEILALLSKLGEVSLHWLILGENYGDEKNNDTRLVSKSDSVDLELLQSAIKLVELIEEKHNLVIPSEHKAKSIKILYEWAIIEEKININDISEEKVMRVVKLAS